MKCCIGEVGQCGLRFRGSRSGRGGCVTSDVACGLVTTATLSQKRRRQSRLLTWRSIATTVTFSRHASTFLGLRFGQLCLSNLTISRHLFFSIAAQSRISYCLQCTPSHISFFSNDSHFFFSNASQLFSHSVWSQCIPIDAPGVCHEREPFRTHVCMMDSSQNQYKKHETTRCGQSAHWQER